MTVEEGKTKFNNLKSVSDLYFTANRLERVPSLRNLDNLRVLHLADNLCVTRSRPNTFWLNGGPP